MELILTIIAINIVFVSINTLRMIFMIKGQRILASILVTGEVFVYLMGLGIVLKNLDKPINIAAYCLGFGLGVFIGSKIEEYLKLGYVMVEVIVDSLEGDLPAKLREYGYGITAWIAEGRDGQRLVMHVLAKRSNERKLLMLLDTLSPKSFVMSYEPKNFRGGFWAKGLIK